MSNNIKRCVFAGTFDPPTKGHTSIINSALKVFDEVIVGVLVNDAKTPLLTIQERVDLLNKAYGNLKGVVIKSYNGLLVDFLKENNTVYTIRGLRNAVDFEYEQKMNSVNKSLMPQIESVCFFADSEYVNVSSTYIKSEITKGNLDCLNNVESSIQNDLLNMLKTK